jgi:hypothetical protein
MFMCAYFSLAPTAPVRHFISQSLGGLARQSAPHMEDKFADTWVRKGYLNLVGYVCSTQVDDLKKRCLEDKGGASTKAYGSFGCDMIDFLWQNMTVTLDADDGIAFRDGVIAKWVPPEKPFAEALLTVGNFYGAATAPADDTLQKAARIFEDTCPRSIRPRLWGTTVDSGNLVAVILAADVGRFVKMLGFSLKDTLTDVAVFVDHVADANERGDAVNKLRAKLRALKTRGSNAVGYVKDLHHLLAEASRDFPDWRTSDGKTKQSSSVVQRVIVSPLRALLLVIAFCSNVVNADYQDKEYFLAVMEVVNNIVYTVLQGVGLAAKKLLRLPAAAARALRSFARRSVSGVSHALGTGSRALGRFVKGWFSGHGGRFMARYQGPFANLWRRVKQYASAVADRVSGRASVLPTESPTAQTSEPASGRPVTQTVQWPTTYAEALTAVVKVIHLRRLQQAEASSDVASAASLGGSSAYLRRGRRHRSRPRYFGL